MYPRFHQKSWVREKIEIGQWIGVGRRCEWEIFGDRAMPMELNSWGSRVQ